MENQHKRDNFARTEQEDRMVLAGRPVRAVSIAYKHEGDTYADHTDLYYSDGHSGSLPPLFKRFYDYFFSDTFVKLDLVCVGTTIEVRPLEVQ